jgi:hypothetical protein
MIHFTAAMICYGVYNHVLFNLRRMRTEARDPKLFSLFIHLNACGVENTQEARSLQPDLLVESSHNLNKCGGHRILNAACQDEYMLLLDDDFQCRPGWDVAVAEFLEKYSPFDLSGELCDWPVGKDVLSFIEGASWRDKTKDALPPGYIRGSPRLINVPFLRRWNFPDHQLLVHAEDTVLSALAWNVGAHVVPWTADLVRFFHDQGLASRGEPRSGFRTSVHPVTGENIMA